MYLDTKNMENANQQTNMTYSRLHAAKSKGRMGKVWKPLLRLLSPKSHQTIDSNKKHPNNINLNNANNINEEPAELIVELPQKTVQIDEELAEWQQQQKYLQQIEIKKTDEAFIKSASIEKSPTSICQNCIHGRNCQHQLHHANLEKFQITVTDQRNVDWSEREQTSDEELLNAWYYYNYRQVAVQASLC